MAKKLGDYIDQNIEGLGNEFKKFGKNYKQEITGIERIFEDLWKDIKSIFKDLADAINRNNPFRKRTTLEKIGDKVEDVAGLNVRHLKDNMQKKFTNFKRACQDRSSDFKKGLSELETRTNSVFDNISARAELEHTKTTSSHKSHHKQDKRDVEKIREKYKLNPDKKGHDRHR